MRSERERDKENEYNLPLNGYCFANVNGNI